MPKYVPWIGTPVRLRFSNTGRTRPMFGSEHNRELISWRGLLRHQEGVFSILKCANDAPRPHGLTSFVQD
jgi:hypothetical protein